ncbi:HD domain-containing protein [Candidatus Saccharibacteria bacterium]|nr:HD domain-containing protein [Candidatus Saccharibacteria bacterium]
MDENNVAMDIWENQKMMMNIAYEPRAGFYECDLYMRPKIVSRIVTKYVKKRNLKKWKKLSKGNKKQIKKYIDMIIRYESVGELSGAMASLVSDLLLAYPEMCKGYSPLLITKVAQIHDIIEGILHDIPDNGSKAHEEKVIIERRLMKEYTERMPKGVGECAYSLFLEMDACSTREGIFLKMADKVQAILKLLYFENKGLYGNVYVRKMSKRDKEHAKIVGTGNCTDAWGYNTYLISREFPEDIVRVFEEILCVAAMDVRGKFFDWWKL